MIIATKAAVATTGGFPYKWVAGDGGDIYTSEQTIPTTWTLRTSSFSGTTINGVASDGETQYVAVGESGKLATSPDGITWTQQTSSFGATGINAIAYGDGYWLAAGDAGKIATSTDGITWTQRTSGVATDLLTAAWGNSLYIVAGADMRTATDPTSTWTARTSTISQVDDGCLLWAPFASVWVAGADTGTAGGLASSTNGTSWTARTSAYTMTGLGGFACNDSVIVMGNQRTSSFPFNTDVQSSTDGATWTDRNGPGTNYRWGAIDCDDVGTFVLMVVGDLGTTDLVFTSSDGITWTNQGDPGFGAGCLCHSSGKPAIR